MVGELQVSLAGHSCCSQLCDILDFFDFLFMFDFDRIVLIGAGFHRFSIF